MTDPSSARTPEALCARDGGALLPRLAAGAPRAEPVVLEVGYLTDAQLERAGLPWRRDHVRALVVGLRDRGVDVTLRASLTDDATTPWELIEALAEASRHRLRRTTGLTVALRADGAPDDPWVRAAGLDDLVTDDGCGTASLARLRERWRAAVDGLDPASDAFRAGERLLRKLDDRPRRLVFDLLEAAWRYDDPGWPGTPPDKAAAVEVAEGILGERERWTKAMRQYTYDATRRLVVIPTWQCELRCTYCWIPKQDGRVMSPRTMERAVDMLVGTDQDAVWMQFFGGEALLEPELVQHGITYGLQRAREEGKEIGFVVSSNGWSLNREILDWLAARRVRLELSLDGDRWTQERFRPSRWKGQSSYDHSIARVAPDILASGIEQYVIMVVHPTNVARVKHNFFHLADLGFRHIQINNMLGRAWTPEQKQVWASQLFELGGELRRRWAAGEALEFINMRHRPMAMRLNGEITIDHDGTIYGGNAFLHETEHKDKFVLAHLDDFTGIDRYWVDATDNNYLLDWSYRPKVTANNVEVGKIMASFCQWMRKQGYGADGPLKERPAARQEGAPA